MRLLLVLSASLFVSHLPACSGNGTEADESSTIEGALATSDVPGDEVVYIGVNSNSRAHELDGLQKGSPVLAIVGERQNGTAQLAPFGQAGPVVDLRTEEGERAFVSSLPKLDQAGREAVQAVLTLTRYPEAKDEMAQLIRVLYEVEQGERKARRLVLSGHSAGFSIRGEREGDALFDFRPLSRLVEAFPKATRAVEHLAISGCNTAASTFDGSWLFPNYQAAFPGLRSIWAYKGNSPTIPHSTEHLKLWELASRHGDAFEARLDRARVQAKRHGGVNGPHVRVWTPERILQD